MPLWLIPPLDIILPLFWWAFAFTKMLRVDAIVEHASAKERKIIWRRHNRQLWLIGGCLSVINLLPPAWLRSEEHTSELQSLMRISYAVFCLKKKKPHDETPPHSIKIHTTK